MSNPRQISQTLILTISLALIILVTNAQTMPPTPSITSGCVDAIFNLTDCLTYVESGSNATKPDKPCCPELAGLIDSNPVCLCELLAGAAESYGIDVDNKRALALPGICHVTTPPVSACALLGVPVDMGPSPAESPMIGGPSPSGEPLLPGSSTAASPKSESSHAASRGFGSTNPVFLVVLIFIAISGLF
ncbi:hypothetical protein LUZ60_010960 [Juncus effusus]|nr:hypothetical protein LUZ60_010960 [Juncus effusus]